MKYITVIVFLLCFIQCSDEADGLIEIDIKTVGTGNIEKSTFQEGESVFFSVSITNLSVDENIIWDLSEGHWNYFKIDDENGDDYDWQANENGICSSPNFDPKKIEPNTTFEFRMSGRGSCLTGSIAQRWPPSGTYTLLHNEDYIFTKEGNDESFEVSAKITKDFEVE